MGKRNLVTGVVLGAIIGGAASLINKETREYAISKMSSTSDMMVHALQNPSQSIRELQTTLIETAQSAADSLDGALNAVDQIEGTISEIRKEDKKKLN